VQPSTLSEKQDGLLATFRTLLETYKIEVVINYVPSGSFKGQTVALDVEHDEAGGFVGCGILVLDSSRVYYFSDLNVLKCCALSTVHAIAHNGITDFECLRSWGIDIKDKQLIWDTMLIGHIIDSSLKTYGLKDMAKRELGIEYPSYDDIVGKRTLKQSKERFTLDKQPQELVAMYNAMDCFVTYKLWDKQRNQGLAQVPDAHYFEDLEKPCSVIFNTMENRGVSVDLTYLEGLKQALEAQKAPLEAQIKAELGEINLNSPKQLLRALNAKEIYPVLKNKPSTDKRALERFKGNRIVDSLLRFSEIETLLTSFVISYLERGQTVVHPRFSQTGTRTGRPSCSNPNLLQIPQRTENGKLVRRMFVPRPGMLMGDCDFGQIEPRVLAHLSEDPTLCKLFNDEIDFHAYTAERLGISRDRAKILNLSVGYRATFKSVASQLKCSDKESQDEINKWWNLFPALRRWQDALIFNSKKSGYCETLMGRRIKVDGLTDGNKWKREAAERQLINNITQGSAAEIMKKAMIDIISAYPSCGLLVQVYDELLFEAPIKMIEEVRMLIIDKMINCVILKVPLTIDSGIGTNWSEAKS